jgi:hypothetical protein
MFDIDKHNLTTVGFRNGKAVFLLPGHMRVKTLPPREKSRPAVVEEDEEEEEEEEEDDEDAEERSLAPSVSTHTHTTRRCLRSSHFTNSFSPYPLTLFC